MTIQDQSDGMMKAAALSSALATDLAAGIYPPKDIFASYGLSELEGVELLSAPWFQKMVQEAKAEWDGLKNSQERIRVKARVAIEESLPILFNLIKSKETPAAARVQAFKELKEIGDVVPRKDEGLVATVPSIVIDLGGGASIQIGSPGVTRDVSDVPEAEEFFELPSPPEKTFEPDDEIGTFLWEPEDNDEV